MSIRLFKHIEDMRFCRYLCFVSRISNVIVLTVNILVHSTNTHTKRDSFDLSAVGLKYLLLQDIERWIVWALQLESGEVHFQERAIVVIESINPHVRTNLVY